MKEKLIRFKQNFLTLPLPTRRLLNLGFVLAFTLALPIFVLAILTGNYDIRERAASGEPAPSPVPGYVILESFETDSNKDNLPDNWTPRNLDANDKLATAVFYDGKKSFRFSPSSATNRESITRTWTFNPPRVPDEEIKLKVFNRVGKNITSGKAGVILSVRYVDGRVETTSGVFPYQQHNWWEKTLIIITDAKYNQIKIQFFNTNLNSNVFVDGLTVQIEGNAHSRDVKETQNELPEKELNTLIEK